MTSKKRAVLLVAVLGLILVLLVPWLLRKDASRQADTAAATGTGSGDGAHTAPEDQPPSWFAMRGAPARRIAGRVTIHGKPVPGVRVTLHSVLTRARWAPVVGQTTDAAGEFDLGVRTPGSYTLAGSATGMTAALLELDLADPALAPPADRLELRLQDCAAAVRGTIIDAAGNPLADVVVSRKGVEGARSGADGAYRLCIPFGRSEIDFTAVGYGSVTHSVAARGETVRDVVLVPEAAIVVQVVRADDTSPVADAHVSVFSERLSMDHPASATGLTDASGQVRLAGLVPGRYFVGGFADGLESDASVEVLAEVGPEPRLLLRLGSRGRVTGRVMDGKTPVAGVRVYATRRSPLARSASGVSQPDGSFVLDRAPFGDLVVSANAYAVVSPSSVQVEAAHDAAAVVLQVRRLGAIRGVVTRGGHPVEGAVVCCARTTEGPLGHATSGPDGRYELRGVQPGRYELNAESKERGAFTGAWEVTVSAGRDGVLDLELDLAASISGVVVDRDGAPVTGVFVTWTHEMTGDLGTCASDRDGNFRCTALSGGGAYRASVSPDEGFGHPFPTADGAPYPVREVADGTTIVEGVTLAIDRELRVISGRVLDDAGVPVPGSIVRAEPRTFGVEASFDDWVRLPTTSTDEDGRFALRQVLRGDYALQARSPDGAEGRLASVSAGSKDVTVRVAAAR